MISGERMDAYLASLNRGNTPLLDQIEREALETNVPIIRTQTQGLIKFLLALRKPMSILEVGCAIGFSALLMSEYAPEGCHITTIEKYEKRIPIARSNFARAGKEESITLLTGDAADILKELAGPYDFIFMDAAKGQYLHFLPEVLRLLGPGGLLVSDNVLQDGDILESRFAVTRRNRTIHSRMREYLYELTHHDLLETVVLPIGDGVTVSVREDDLMLAAKAASQRSSMSRTGECQKTGILRGVLDMTNKKRKKPELLVPASSLEVLKTAVIFGADAVYIGGEAYGLRAKAKNFSMEEMAEGIAYAHERNVRVYVTANILAHNCDLEGAKAYFGELKNLKPDALIISDPGMVMLAREICPEIDIHISTQANNTNYMTYRFWYEQGAKRVVSARELSLKEIKEIRENIPEEMEIESFVHGAMCISYSGRCLLSSYLTGRSANRGACTHPCRWKYALMEETRPGEYMPVFENDRGTYIFNSKDLNMIEHIPELVEAGIDSFKIEGRMKTALYVAAVARTYRRAIDDYFCSEEQYRANMDWYRAEIAKCTYRKFTTGFYFGKADETTQIYDESTYVSEYTYLGIVGAVREAGTGAAEGGNGQGQLCARIEQRNKFSVGDEIEIMKSNGENISVRVLAMYDEEGKPMESCPHPKQIVDVKLSQTPEAGDILRVEKQG